MGWCDQILSTGLVEHYGLSPEVSERVHAMSIERW
jgi:hypothetical protein